MQVLCMASSKERADVACPACGQTYTVYYSRPNAPECASALESVREALIKHHEKDASAAAHPQRAFNVPEWSGPVHMSGAALLSGAPVRTLPEQEEQEEQELLAS